MMNRPYQSGSALLVCLVLLVIMTLLVIGGLTTSTVEEKMAGNTQNKQTSFQAAEAALRASESTLASLSAPVFDGTNGLYPRTKPGDANYPIWTFEGTPAITWRTVNVPNAASLAKAPEAIVEEYGTVYRDASCPLIVPLPPDCAVPVYRITARGWGPSETHMTLLQSTFRVD